MKLTITIVFAAVFAIIIKTDAIADTAPQIAQDWCRLDAPGIWRQLRSDARDAGQRQIEACPAAQPAQTLPESLIIPLPCGRSMEFRRIDVPSSHVLDQIEITFGGAPDTAEAAGLFAQNSLTDVVSGSFVRQRDEQGGGPAINYKRIGARSYYLASHELTELQYSLVTNGILTAWSSEERPDSEDAAALCAIIADNAQKLKFNDVLPARDLSWFDTQNIVYELNSYLMTEGERRIKEGKTPLLPWEHGSTGFVRLPTEAEWEFGALGGRRGLSLGRRFPPMLDARLGEPTLPDLNEIAVIAGSSGRGTIASVGSRAPNMLGLFDTVGNVSEIVNDLFSLRRPDGEHGARGGMTLRGGNALTPVSLIGLPHREEIPLFSAEGPGKSFMGGVRLAISAPILPRGIDPSGERAPDFVNSELTQALTEQQRRMVEVRQTPGASFRSEARDLLSTLNGVSPGSDVSDQTAAALRALEQSEAAINAAQEAEIYARVRSAADAIYAVRNLSAIALTWFERLEKAHELSATITGSDRADVDNRLRLMEGNIVRRVSMINIQVREVQRMLDTLSKAAPDIVDAAREDLAQSLRSNNIDLYESMVWPIYDQALARKRLAPGVDHFDALKAELDVFAQERRERFNR